jgi:hypothetical protein
MPATCLHTCPCHRRCQLSRPACHLPTPLPAYLPQVEGCSEDLSCAKAYFQRSRVCSDHLHMFSLLVDGKPSRFCQRCNRFHELPAFDGKKK